MTIAWLATNSWAGVFWYRCIVLHASPKRTRVRMTARSNLPRRGWVAAGTEVTVPSDAITLKRPPGITRSGQGMLLADG